MSIGWYVRRLANMSLPEVLHRTLEAQRKRMARRRAFGWEAFAAKGTLCWPHAMAPDFIRGVDSDLAQAIRAAADNILNGHFEAHGVAWPKRAADDLFPSELWRLDPVSGGLWPGSDLYCFDIPYRHERKLGDVKYVWDLNRLQFLQPLAAAAALFDDKAALAAIRRAIASWREANPPFRGIAWNSGIELALRAFSVIFAILLCGESLGKETLDQAEEILRAHFFWLARYPSRFSSANNHLVAEALGEFAIGCVLPDLADARARQVLEKEARLQIFSDGVSAEQSPTYGAFTAEMLLAADWLGRAADKPLAPEVGDRLIAFAGWVAWMSDARGGVPNIGDDDEGRVLSLCSAREYAYPASVARLVCRRFGLPLNAPLGRDAPELRDALYRDKNAENLQPQPLGLKTFAEGGYTIVRETRAGKKLRFMLDHGPLGYLSIAAHGHADANAFTLALNDKDIFVDPGTYLYHSGGAWRDWFRGTPAHNTLCLDGADQSVIAGPFNWGAKARAQLDQSAGGANWSLAASHDGYVGRYGLEHRREVSAQDAGVRIVDRLVGSAKQPAALVSLQAAPDLEIIGSGLDWRVQKNGVTLVTIAFSRPGETRVIKAGALGEGGWVSPCFGTKLAADRLVWRGSIPAEGLETNLSWRPE